LTVRMGEVHSGRHRCTLRASRHPRKIVDLTSNVRHFCEAGAAAPLHFLPRPSGHGAGD
jgi:hypothetical protein